MENFDPRGQASLEPKGLMGRIYVGDHYKLLYIATYYVYKLLLMAQRRKTHPDMTEKLLTEIQRIEPNQKKNQKTFLKILL